MFTVEYYWEMVFDTKEEAEEFALQCGPIYDMLPLVIKLENQ